MVSLLSAGTTPLFADTIAGSASEAPAGLSEPQICRLKMQQNGCDMNSKDPDYRDCSKDPTPLSDTAWGIGKCGVDTLKDIGGAVTSGFGYKDSPEYRDGVYQARRVVFLKGCQADSECLGSLYKAAYGTAMNDRQVSQYRNAYFPTLDNLWNQAALKQGWGRPGSDPWFTRVAAGLNSGLQTPKFDTVGMLKKQYSRFFCLSTKAQVEMACGVAIYAVGGTSAAFEALGMGTRLSRLAGLARMTAQGTRLETIAMRAKYIGEEARAGGPVYLTEAERATRKITIKNGLLYDSNGQLLNAKDALYVMDKDGNLYASTEWKGRSMVPKMIDKDGNLVATTRQLQHSSFFAGGDVAGAGTIEVRAGKIVRITRDSGHYKPYRRILDQVVAELGQQGVDTSGTYIDYSITQP